MTDRALLQQALEALDSKYIVNCGAWRVQQDQAITALRERLAQPEQKPMAWVTGWHGGHCVIRTTDPAVVLPIGTALYTAPPQRKPLSEEEIQTYRHMIDWTAEWSYINFARAIEAAHGIKGKA